MPLRVLHLAGSPTTDLYAELSRVYAAQCLTATADPSAYDVHVAFVTPDRHWRFPADLDPDTIAASPALDFAAAVAHVAALEPDVMVPQMFCRPGMTHYRALFDVLGVPYVGNTAAAMALTADKAQAKAVVAAAGVRVPAGQVVRRGERPTVPLPVVVKPVDSDNSFGVTLVADPADLDAALGAALEHADGALVETFVPLGREVRCGVVERDGDMVCLPLEEYPVAAGGSQIRTAADKLEQQADGRLRLVAKDGDRSWFVEAGDPITAAVHDAARTAYVALGCRHYGLFDFRVDPRGRPWFLEAGLYCTFAPHSVVAAMAQAAGIPIPELFRSMLHRAVRG